MARFGAPLGGKRSFGISKRYQISTGGFRGPGLGTGGHGRFEIPKRRQKLPPHLRGMRARKSQWQHKAAPRQTLYEKRQGGRELKLEFGSRARSHMYVGKPGETYTASTFRLGPKDLQAKKTTRKLGWREKVTIADVPGAGKYSGESGLANPRHAFMARKNRQREQRQYEAAVDAPMKFPE